MGADERCAVRNSLYDLDLAKSRQSDHDLGVVLGLSDSEGREARWASVLLSDLLRSCSFLGPRRRLSAQPPQSFKIIVEGLYNFDRVIGPFRFNYPLTVTAT